MHSHCSRVIATTEACRERNRGDIRCQGLINDKMAVLQCMCHSGADGQSTVTTTTMTWMRHNADTGYSSSPHGVVSDSDDIAGNEVGKHWRIGRINSAVLPSDRFATGLQSFERVMLTGSQVSYRAGYTR